MAHENSHENELRGELYRVVCMLAGYLRRQREGGRSAGTDALRGVAIDPGEAEEWINALSVDLRQPRIVTAHFVPPPMMTGALTPLKQARRRFQMQPPEFDALILALSVELDQRFANLVAFLNDHITRSRPTLGLILALRGDDANAVALRDRPAFRLGLLQLEGSGPTSLLSIRVADEFLKRLVAPASDQDFPAGWVMRSRELVAFDRFVLSEAQRIGLSHWSYEMRESRLSAGLIVAGPTGSGRVAAVTAASISAGRPVLDATWAGSDTDFLRTAIREAIWNHATLVLRVDETGANVNWAEVWRIVHGSDLPVVLALPDSVVEAAAASMPTEPIVIRFSAYSAEQRERLWDLALMEHPEISSQERRGLASRFDFLPGAIARSVRKATANTSKNLRVESLDAACREVGASGMSFLAQKLEQRYTRADLVLPVELCDELNLAGAWIRNQRRVFEDWGFRRRLSLGRGLTALFAGPPGTGKTMAAQVLASELGLDLYRVDLSQVMSKYIGETEKQLSRLFRDARASGSILFFDEADALFGKRSEVKDAHDRYANLEIGYLLQRLEEHPGTTILATNRKGDMDAAFVRRFHFLLDFPLPRLAERRRIWEGMLPRQADIEPGIDLESLARDHEISGGEIRNCVLSAAFMAAEEGVPIGLRHLKRGLRRELTKTGRVLDSRQRRSLETD